MQCVGGSKLKKWVYINMVVIPVDICILHIKLLMLNILTCIPTYCFGKSITDRSSGVEAS